MVLLRGEQRLLEMPALDYKSAQAAIPYIGMCYIENLYLNPLWSTGALDYQKHTTPLGRRLISNHAVSDYENR